MERGRKKEREREREREKTYPQLKSRHDFPYHEEKLENAQNKRRCKRLKIHSDKNKDSTSSCVEVQALEDPQHIDDACPPPHQSLYQSLRET